ncbi:MAG: hypothetical protein J4G09_05090 [Proteobacteria bacterium]|nr:hypothetical protein [Pseudomonadota bacterium]
MSEFLLVSHILLWIGFFVLLLIGFALLRQIGVLFERVAPAGALALGSTLRAGETAPVLRPVALSGESLEIGGTRPDGVSTLVLFVSPDCPVCKGLLPVAKSLARKTATLRVIYASAGSDVQVQEEFVAAHGLPRAAYVISDDLGLVFGVAKLPFAALIAPDGSVSALGLVNTREHLESLFEAQRTGIASLQEYLSERPQPGSRGADRESGEPGRPDPRAGVNRRHRDLRMQGRLS